MKLCSVLREKMSVTPTPAARILWMASAVQRFCFSLLCVRLDILEAPEEPASSSPSLSSPSPVTSLTHTWVTLTGLHLPRVRSLLLRPISLRDPPSTHTRTGVGLHVPPVWRLHLHRLREVTGAQLAEHPERDAPTVLRSANFHPSSHSLRGLCSDHRSGPELQSPPIGRKNQKGALKADHSPLSSGRPRRRTVREKLRARPFKGGSGPERRT